MLVINLNQEQSRSRVLLVQSFSKHELSQVAEVVGGHVLMREHPDDIRTGMIQGLHIPPLSVYLTMTCGKTFSRNSCMNIS